MKNLLLFMVLVFSSLGYSMGSRRPSPCQEATQKAEIGRRRTTNYYVLTLNSSRNCERLYRDSYENLRNHSYVIREDISLLGSQCASSCSSIELSTCLENIHLANKDIDKTVECLNQVEVRGQEEWPHSK